MSGCRSPPDPCGAVGGRRYDAAVSDEAAVHVRTTLRNRGAIRSTVASASVDDTERQSRGAAVAVVTFSQLDGRAGPRPSR